MLQCSVEVLVLYVMTKCHH